MARQFFGTDGVRGRVGDLPMHPEWVLRLGWAAGHVLTAGAQGRPRVVIGKDTRLSGYLLESALESGLAAAGVDVLLVGPLPTPAIAYLTRTLRADAGIVISASHNPFPDNGIKFFSGDGLKLADEIEEAIEARMNLPLTLPEADRLGKARRVDDAAGRYVEFCKTTFPSHLDLRGLRLVLDCAHGATYKVAPMVFAELGAQIEAIGVQPDGLNINAEVGSTAPELLRSQVVASGADMGIAFDGDGDRLLLVDGEGELWDGDSILWLLAGAMREAGTLNGVVGTLMSNLALEQAFADWGVPFVRAAVGDRYVLEQMRARGYPLGGESSGHIISPANTAGDGILAALQVLAIVQQRRQPLHALRGDFRLAPQILRSLPITDARAFVQRADVQEAIRRTAAELGGRGRLLVRPSGTEPLLRIMVEASDHATAEAAATGLGERLTLLYHEQTRACASN